MGITIVSTSGITIKPCSYSLASDLSLYYACGFSSGNSNRRFIRWSSISLSICTSRRKLSLDSDLLFSFMSSSLVSRLNLNLEFLKSLDFFLSISNQLVWCTLNFFFAGRWYLGSYIHQISGNRLRRCDFLCFTGLCSCVSVMSRWTISEKQWMSWKCCGSRAGFRVRTGSDSMDVRMSIKRSFTPSLCYIWSCILRRLVL